MKVFTLGKPRIVGDDGEKKTVRGQQPWALLGRLLTAERQLSRRTLANELFCEAEDPLGALRWSLASLRRALGPDTLSGDQIKLNLPAGTHVDILNLSSTDAERLVSADFLEGIAPTSSAEFSTWLLIARERISTQIDEILRRAAIKALANGDFDTAVRVSERAVRFRPLDEGAHVLLVKALAMSRKMDAATAHIEATERGFESAGLWGHVTSRIAQPLMRFSCRTLATETSVATKCRWRGLDTSTQISTGLSGGIPCAIHRSESRPARDTDI